MTITLADRSKGTCVGNDNRDLSYVVRLMILHDLNLIKQTPFLVYFASFFGSNISTSDLKGMLIHICDFGKYAPACSWRQRWSCGKRVGLAVRRSQVPL